MKTKLKHGSHLHHHDCRSIADKCRNSGQLANNAVGMLHGRAEFFRLQVIHFVSTEKTSAYGSSFDGNSRSAQRVIYDSVSGGTPKNHQGTKLTTPYSFVKEGNQG